jgi:hypothetical protein
MKILKELSGLQVDDDVNKATGVEARFVSK